MTVAIHPPNTTVHAGPQKAVQCGQFLPEGSLAPVPLRFETVRQTDSTCNSFGYMPKSFATSAISSAWAHQIRSGLTQRLERLRCP